jgi:SAM-dependent methyltransferase
MAHTVCPWWLGYFLANPLRRLWQDPRTILQPFVSEGMLVLEPGCGMGFFTIEMARLVGLRGKVVAVDVQSRMIAGLQRRARRAGLESRIDARLACGDNLGVDDLNGAVDFAFAFAVVHELPDAGSFLAELHRALRPGSKILVAEPKRHVGQSEFSALAGAAEHAGYRVADGPTVRSSWTAVFERI